MSAIAGGAIPEAAVPARSARAGEVRALVADLQRRFVDRLEAVAGGLGDPARFAPSSWLRDEGRHGGGVRFGVADTDTFDRASINTSSVHYDDAPERKLAAATALSAIVHPRHPRAPSIHVHVSHTETRDGHGYWRVMADLNPSSPEDSPLDRSVFQDALAAAAGPLFADGAAQGDRYFEIPALGRRRGVVHFYLEAYDSGDFAADFALARRVEEAAIDTYAAILARALEGAPPPDDGSRARQLAYHTVYLFQVTTLDRGTTSGLLVHDQNDVGILGSLPGHVDRRLLASWRARVPAPQGELVDALVEVLARTDRGDGVCEVDEAAKAALAVAIRRHYTAHPDALALQASGDVVPPTVGNHGR